MLANITTTSLRFYGSLMLVFFCLLLAMINLASNYRDSLVEMREKRDQVRIVETAQHHLKPIIDRSRRERSRGCRRYSLSADRGKDDLQERKP
jgi:hypothetical protein